MYSAADTIIGCVSIIIIRAAILSIRLLLSKPINHTNENRALLLSSGECL